MMLVLPVQAFASVAMLGYELPPAGAEVQASMVQALTDHDMAGCHHEAAADKPTPPAAEHQCSHCTACYLAAAFPIPAAVTSFAAPVPSTPHVHYAAQFSGFIPEGPERPPRTLA